MKFGFDAMANYRNRDFMGWSLVLCLLIAVSSMLFIAVRAPLTYYGLYHEHATAYTQANIQQELREKCLLAPSIEELWACFSEVQIEPRHETRRAEEDLQAQKQMAKWALYIFVATVVIGIVNAFITGIGILFVKRTLEQQRIATERATDANRIATEQFKAGLRPRILVSIAGPFLDRSENPTGAFGPDEQERAISIFGDIVIHCAGDVPAIIESVCARLMSGKDWPYGANHPGWSDMKQELLHVLQKNEKIIINPFHGVRQELGVP